MKFAPIAISALALLSLGNAQAAFTGDIDTSLWATDISTDGNGSAVVSPDKSTLTLVSNDVDGSSSLWGNASAVDYRISLAAPELLSFHWAYSTLDDNGSTQDPFGYTVNGVFTQLSQDGSWAAQSGDVSLNLSAGQTFAFTLKSADSIFGAATVVVSQVSAVPEPAELALSLAGLLAVVGASRRSRAMGRRWGHARPCGAG